MNIFLLVVIMISTQLQSVAQKQYSLKTGNKGAYLFNAVTGFLSAVVFICTDDMNFSFEPEVIPYALGFAASYGAAILFTFLGIREGSMSLTSLATSYSLIIPTAYGLLFLNESANWFLYIGIALLLCSLFLVNTKKGDNKITLKWGILVLLAFLGNGLGSTLQTAQQQRFDGKYKSEFMVIALILVSVFFLIFSIVTEKDERTVCFKKGTVFMIVNGIANGVANLLVMVLVSRGMAASVMFPVISAGGIILTALVSLLLYKEKLTAKQYVGLLLGAASVAFMNL